MLRAIAKLLLGLVVCWCFLWWGVYLGERESLPVQMSSIQYDVAYISAVRETSCQQDCSEVCEDLMNFIKMKHAEEALIMEAATFSFVGFAVYPLSGPLDRIFLK
jgi:hypothetical protein